MFAFDILLAVCIGYVAFLFGVAFRFLERRIPGAAAIGRSGRTVHPRSPTLGASS